MSLPIPSRGKEVTSLDTDRLLSGHLLHLHLCHLHTNSMPVFPEAKATKRKFPLSAWMLIELLCSISQIKEDNESHSCTM